MRSLAVHSGNKYEGEWLKGVYHGRGKLTYADGRKYDGEWREVRPVYDVDEFLGTLLSENLGCMLSSNAEHND